MIFRKARMSDLPQIKAVYTDITQDLINKNIPIWDEIYPVCYFAADIEKGELYLLFEGENLIGGFALNETDAGADKVSWEKGDAKALYLNRLGVNINYLRRGIGSQLLERAYTLGKDLGAEYLRLFVVYYNQPAIELYEKHDWKKAEGVYEKYQQGVYLREYGYEKQL